MVYFWRFKLFCTINSVEYLFFVLIVYALRADCLVLVLVLFAILLLAGLFKFGHPGIKRLSCCRCLRYLRRGFYFIVCYSWVWTWFVCAGRFVFLIVYSSRFAGLDCLYLMLLFLLRAGRANFYLLQITINLFSLHHTYVNPINTA